MLTKFARSTSYFFYILFFLVPLVLFPNTSEVFEFNKIIIVYIMTSFILGSWLTKMAISRKIIFRRTILDIPLLIFLFSQFLSTIMSIDQRTSALGYYSRFHGGLISSITYSILYWAYVANMDRKKTIKSIYVLLTSATLVSIYAILEHFGIDKDLWVQDVQNRVFSTLGQPNWLAAFIVALIPITWAFALKAPSDYYTISKKKVLNRLKLNQWLWIVLSVIFTLTLLYTKSRSGIMGFAVCFVVFWGLTLWHSKKTFLKVFVKPFTYITISTLLLIALVGTSWTPSIKDLLTKGLTSNQANNQADKVTGPALETYVTESGEIRKIVWQGALDIWKNYPVFGAGLETFAFSYYNFRPISHNLVSEWDFLYNKAHNEYLNLLATSGIIGLLAYGTLATIIIVSFIKQSNTFDKNPDSNLSNILQFALLGGFLNILATNFFGFSVVVIGLLFFLYPAFALAIKFSPSEKSMKEDTNNLALGQNNLAFIPIILTLFLLFIIFRYWYADINYTSGKRNNDAGKFDVGQTYLLKATNLSSKEAIFWDELSKSSVGLSQALFEQDKNDLASQYSQKAIEESNRAINMAPANVNLKRSQVSTYIKLSPQNPNLLLNAREMLLKAIEQAPTDAKLYYNLGILYARIGDIEKSFEIFQKTIDLKSNYRNPRFALALLYIDAGKIDAARYQLEYILTRITPEDTIVQQELDKLNN